MSYCFPNLQPPQDLQWLASNPPTASRAATAIAISRFMPATIGVTLGGRHVPAARRHGPTNFARHHSVPRPGCSRCEMIQELKSASSMARINAGSALCRCIGGSPLNSNSARAFLSASSPDDTGTIVPYKSATQQVRIIVNGATKRTTQSHRSQTSQLPCDPAHFRSTPSSASKSNSATASVIGAATTNASPSNASQLIGAHP